MKFIFLQYLLILQDMSSSDHQLIRTNTIDIQSVKFQAPRSNTLEAFPDKSSFILTPEQLKNILKTHLSYGDYLKEKNLKNEQGIKLRTPPETLSKFSNIWPYIFRLKNIMGAAMNKQELKKSQFQEFQQFFKLCKNQTKLMSYPDQMILQTLRFAIFNGQQIPISFVKVIIQMTKANFIRKWEVSSYFFQTAFTYDIISKGLQPPLDLYVQFLDKGLINPSEQQLIQVFSKNQFLFESISNKKVLYRKLGQKKRLIYNQFPYLINIFDKINTMDPINFNFARLRQYIEPTVHFLELSNQNQLFDRYLPEVKCHYLKIKGNLTATELEYLFVVLKSVECLCQSDLKIIYTTKPVKTRSKRQNWVNSLIQFKSLVQFWKIQEQCQNILTKKGFHLNYKELDEIGELIDYSEAYSADLIKINLIFIILREETYYNQSFLKSLFKNIVKVFKNIPDKKKKKECCYILLLQFFKLVEQSPDRRAQIMKEYSFPEPELDLVLDEGREVALDLLLSISQKNLILDEKKYFAYMEIVKNLMNETKNGRIKDKSIDLCKRLKKINKFKSQDLKFYEQNIANAHECISFLEAETQTGSRISVQCIEGIIKILYRSNDASILRSCISTIRHIVENRKIGQHFPYKFQEKLIPLITHLYFEAYVNEECKDQILKLVILSTELSDSYIVIDVLAKFLLQVYLKSPANSLLSIYSSLGFFMASQNFKQKSHNNYGLAKDFMSKFSNKTLKSYKKQFSPNNKGNINILCAFLALANNQILLPSELIEQLTLIAWRNRDFMSLALTTVLVHVTNPNSKPISEKSMANICQILRQNDQIEKIGVGILEKCIQKNNNLPKSVQDKIQSLKNIKIQLGKKISNLYKIKENKELLEK